MIDSYAALYIHLQMEKAYTCYYFISQEESVLGHDEDNNSRAHVRLVCLDQRIFATPLSTQECHRRCKFDPPTTVLPIRGGSINNGQVGPF